MKEFIKEFLENDSVKIVTICIGGATICILALLVCITILNV